MADKLLYTFNADTQNYRFLRLKLKRLDTHFNEPTNQNSLKVPKMVKPTNIIKLYYKTLGTSVINNPVSPPSLLRP